MSIKRISLSAIGSPSLSINTSVHTFATYSISTDRVGGGVSSGISGGHLGLQTMRPSANMHGNVNIMLGGAMLSVVITVVCFVCYCCHRNIKKRSSSSIYRQRWLETDPNMEIYSVEQCYDTSALFMDTQETLPVTLPGHGPPPSYEQVVAYDELVSRQQLYYKNNHHSMENYCVFAAAASTEPPPPPSSMDSELEFKATIKCDNDYSDGISDDSLDPHTPAKGGVHCVEDSLRREFHHKSTTTCQYCGKNMKMDSALATAQNNSESCRCQNITNYFYSTNNNNNNNIVTTIYNSLDENQTPSGTTNENFNFPSTSTTSNYNSHHQQQHPLQQSCDNNNISINSDNVDNNDDCDNSNNNNFVEIDFDNINENGIIRLDMSQIIDSTGLPTYEAALKLESSGYV